MELLKTTLRKNARRLFLTIIYFSGIFLGISQKNYAQASPKPVVMYAIGEIVDTLPQKKDFYIRVWLNNDESTNLTTANGGVSIKTIGSNGKQWATSFNFNLSYFRNGWKPDDIIHVEVTWFLNYHPIVSDIWRKRCGTTGENYTTPAPERYIIFSDDVIN